MIKPIRTPQLSSVKPRCGLLSIADLIPRLIRQYEIQAEYQTKLNDRQSCPNLSPSRNQRGDLMTTARNTGSYPQPPHSNDSLVNLAPVQPYQQTTFAWYE